GDGGCVLQRRAGDLGRGENTHFDHVTVLAGGGVVAMIARLGAHFIDHHGRFGAAVVHDLAQRLFEGPTQDANAGFLVIVLALDVADRFERAQQRDPAAGDDAFFDGGTRGVQRVFDAGLLFLHLDFGGSTDLDQGHAAGQLGDPLLQLFLVVVGGGFLDLGADLLDPGFDVVVGTGAVDDGGVFLGQLDLLGLAEIFQGDLFQAHAEVFGDDLAAGE